MVFMFGSIIHFEGLLFLYFKFQTCLELSVSKNDPKLLSLLPAPLSAKIIVLDPTMPSLEVGFCVCFVFFFFFENRILLYSSDWF